MAGMPKWLPTALMACVTGCTFAPAASTGDTGDEPTPIPDAATGDAGRSTGFDPDASESDSGLNHADGGEPDADPGAPCDNWGAPFFDACSVQANAELRLEMEGVYVFDTDALTLRNPESAEVAANIQVVPQGARSAVLVVAQRIFIDDDTELRAVGSRPLMLAAGDIASLRGTINVQSVREGTNVVVGAGANVFCPIDDRIDGREAEPDRNGVGGSGGAGGTFMAPGGEGGDTTNRPMDGGRPLTPEAPPTILRGGCPGGRGVGQITRTPDDIAPGGPGGGAVLIAAKSVIQFEGTIHAGGAGGATGGNWSGGGGGGSGGMVVIQANIINVMSDARIVAHGGGGAGSAAHNAIGEPGANADLDVDRGAPGGAKGDHEHTAVGGAGAYADQPAINGTTGFDSGGGGGGSVGYISLRGDLINIDEAAIISPAQQAP